MKHTLTYQPKALEDVESILSFLQTIHPELPRRFRNLLAEKLEQLDQYPERWSALSNGIRAIRMKLSKRLAYYCFYTYYEDEGLILVLRVFPQQADSKNWPE